MTIYLYKYHFPPELTTKVYIGKTNDPNRRESEHKSDARNGSRLSIHRAMRKYGIDNAIFEVVGTCIKEEYANEAEIALIKQYNSFGENGYNMTPGGDGAGCGENNHNFGKHPSEETRKKHSIAKSGEKCYLFGKFGKDNTKSKVWKIYFKDGRVLIMDNTRQWCKQNGYDRSNVSHVFSGKLKRHKDIIKVEKLSNI